DAPTEAELERLSLAVAEVGLAQGAEDVYVADTAAKQARILEIRSKIYEAIKPETHEILDVSLPLSQIAGHVKFVQEVSRKRGLWLPTFGHAGDGNVHTHLMRSSFEAGRPVPMTGAVPLELFDEVRDEIYRDAKSRGGVVSGEHGIGLVKKRFLAFSLGERQVDLMRGIKRIFDPAGILNPGKVFDP
ncbi:MAG: FAD-binding oxidoreductase, partial [Candidatus Aminicenantes bacterium]|nr:FAD-binding oxidoreductase [Candidatus Aminicenantes bacterium]